MRVDCGENALKIAGSQAFFAAEWIIELDGPAVS